VALTWTGYLRVYRRTAVNLFNHRGLGIAKAAAYSALLAFFPVLATGAAILAQTNADFVSRTISEFLFEVAPPGTEELLRNQFVAQGERPLSLLWGAGIFSIWAASGVVRSLIDGYNAAYHITAGRSVPRSLALSMTLVILSTIPMLAACGLLLFGGYVDRLAARAFVVEPMLQTAASGWWAELSRVARYVVAFGAAVAVNALLYYFGPIRRQRWSLVWRGAVIATLLWMAATVGFGWYVTNLAHYNAIYQGIGASITLLVWMYIMSLVTLFGCEFNAEYERHPRRGGKRRSL
jgi:membrane protein